jgi:Flp pilus assembly protein TadD
MNSTPSWLLIFVLLVGVLALGASVRADASQIWQRSYDLEAQGEHAASLAALNELPEESKTGYLFLVRRAWLLHLSARYQEAVGAYRQAIEAAPKAVEPREGILAPLIALHRFQDAEAEAQAALRLDKDNHSVSRSLAWALYNLGRFDNAERVYRRVLELHPSDLTMQAGVGWCLLRRGRPAEAEAEFREVLRVAPENASARTGLASATAPR